MRNKVLITGSAGFIGYHLTKKLLLQGFIVVGLDNLNSYYDLKLKKDRLNNLNKLALKKNIQWKFIERDLVNITDLETIFDNFRPEVVINLAAQAGVRYSIENPDAYIKSNINGFYNIIEMCKSFKVRNFIFASSSSVYGGNSKVPFSEKDSANNQLSLYAATKKANESIAHSYSHLYKIPTTGLRFFTVYGPWGRPDMAPMIFLKSILNNQPIEVFNNGKMKRDFTYIDDVVEGILKCCLKPATPEFEIDSNSAPFRIFNIGNGKPIQLMDFIEILENKVNLKAIKKFMPMQKGDVVETFADINNLKNWINYKPETDISSGLDKFVEWYKDYYSSKYHKN